MRARWTVWLCWASAAASVAVLGALLYYAQPMGDDFCAAGSGGIWVRVLRYYSHVTGRWAAIGVDLLIARSTNLFRDYAAVLAGLCLLRIAATYALFRTIMAADVPRKRCWTMAASFSLFYWCAMPSIGDSMFWLCGAVFYELAATGTMLFLAALWRKELTLPRTCALAAGAIVLTGFHELAGCALLATVLAGCVLAFRNRGRDRAWWVVLLAAVTGGFLLVALSPANFARAAQQMNLAGSLRSAVSVAVNSVAWTLRWWMDAPVLFACAALLLDPELRLRKQWTGTQITVPAVGALTLLAGFVLGIWGLHGAMPGRVLNWLYLVFLVTLGGTLLVWRPALPAGLPRQIRSFALAGMFVSMCVTGNPWVGAADLAWRVPQWSRTRLDAMQRIQSTGSVTALPPTPHMYFDFDIVADPSDFSNVCVARYYGLPSVSSSNPGESPRGAAFSGRGFGLRGGKY